MRSLNKRFTRVVANFKKIRKPPGTACCWGQLFLIWMSLTIFEGAPLPRRRLDKDVMLFILSSRMADATGFGFLENENATFSFISGKYFIQGRIHFLGFRLLFETLS